MREYLLTCGLLVLISPAPTPAVIFPISNLNNGFGSVWLNSSSFAASSSGSTLNNGSGSDSSSFAASSSGSKSNNGYGSDSSSFAVSSSGSSSGSGSDSSSFAVSSSGSGSDSSSFAGPTPGKTTFYPFQATVQIGDGEGDGTDDTVKFIKICGSSGCCETDILNHWFYDDWSRGDTEVWGSDYFGDCSTSTFDVCEGLEVAIFKEVGDNLKVKMITLELANVANADDTTKFHCSDYVLGENASQVTRTCQAVNETSVCV